MLINSKVTYSSLSVKAPAATFEVAANNGVVIVRLFQARLDTEWFADTLRRAFLRVEWGWEAKEPCGLSQGGCDLFCKRGELNKDPAGALIYATR